MFLYVVAGVHQILTLKGRRYAVVAALPYSRASLQRRLGFLPFQSDQAIVQRILNVNPFLQARSLRIKMAYHSSTLLCRLERTVVPRLN